MRVKIFGKNLFRATLIVAISGVVGLLLLLAAFLLPTERICAHVERSISTLTQETDYFSLTQKIPGTYLDNYTEALYLNQAMIGHKDVGLLAGALGGYCYDARKDYNPVGNLAEVLESPNEATIVSQQSRFFNGYEIFVKALLLVTDYSGIRQFNLFSEFFLYFLLCYLMLKRKLGEYILPVTISLLFINPLTVALNMTFSGFYFCMMIPCIIMLAFNEKFVKSGLYWVLFEIIGICAFFFNMNYFQLATFGVPLAFYYILNGFPKRAVDLIKTTAYFFVSWFVGYAGIMVFKWAIYAITINPNMFIEMFDAITIRLSSKVDAYDISRIAGIKRNVGIALLNNWWDITELTFVLYVFTKAAKEKKKLYISAAEIAFLVIMSALPICRYFIYANHVYIHGWVTYRILILPVIAFNLLCVKALGVKSEKDMDKY